MKSIIKIGCVVVLSIIYISCKKQDSIPNKLSQLQGNWIIDSVVICDSKQHTGFAYKQNTTGTSEFRADNKMYSDNTIIDNSLPLHFVDTSNYSFEVDENLVLMANINPTKTYPSSDSLSVDLLTDSLLVYSRLDQNASHWYPKTFLHKK